jgi:hypothetical protein
MAKYYMVKTYTCYCGEEVYHYLKIEDNEMIESPKYMDIIYDWIGDDAYDWWDDETCEEFDGDYDAYLGECGYDIYEITKSEYEYDTRNDI